MNMVMKKTKEYYKHLYPLKLGGMAKKQHQKLTLKIYKKFDHKN